MTLLTSIVLARLLAPSDFGLMAMAMVVIGFADLFANLGTSAAVVQQRTLSEEFLSSLFWLNVLSGLAAMSLIMGMASVAANLYREPRLTPIMQWLAVSLFISSLRSTPQALLQRNLAFDRIAKVEIGASVVSLFASVGAALLGFGVWSLVIQSLTMSAFMAGLIWRASHWRPKCAFCWTDIKSVAGFSLNLTGYNVFNYFARNADNFLIGRYLGAQDLGYYDLAYRFLLYPVNAISSVVGRVLFPAYSRAQDDNARLGRAFLLVAGSIALICFPTMFGLMVLADPVVLTVFGAKWSAMIPVLVILAPLGAVQSIGTLVGTIYQAKGRTDWLLWWGIVTGSLTVLAFVIGLRWGIVGVAGAYTVSSVLLTYPSFAIAFRLIELRVTKLVLVLWRPFAAASIMVLGELWLKAVLPSNLAHTAVLATTVPIGVIIYAIATWWLNRSGLLELKALLSSKP